MARGYEGQLNTGAESRMIRDEERSPVRSAELIASQREAGVEAVSNSRLTAALIGEELFRMIGHQRDPDKQLSLAKDILKSTPYIIKLLPPHITEETHRAARIVAIALALHEEVQKMN